MSFETLIADYLSGPDHLRRAVAGLNREQLFAHPVAGKWSMHECVCHIADFEPVYVDRIKRVIAQENPTFFGGDPDLFASRLFYGDRNTETELQMVAACRAHLGAILKRLAPADFERKGNHSEAGLMTLEKLLRNVTGHIPHHIAFISEKRQALGV
jgi:hypothetical protein